MSQNNREHEYLILDSRNELLARCVQEPPPGVKVWQLLVLDGGLSQVMRHEQVKLIPTLEEGEPLLGRILHNLGNRVIVEKLKSLDSDLRENLRMPTDFESFLYPLSGSWRGRRRIMANDLSCGGVAFFCREELAQAERVEVVVPVTSQPLVVGCQILRRRPSDRDDAAMYAAQFIGICHDEEAMLRQAVFSIQIKSRSRAGQR